MYSNYELKHIKKLLNIGLDVHDTLERPISTKSTISVICDKGHINEGIVKNLTRLKKCPTCLRIEPFYELENKLKSYNYQVITTDLEYGGSESSISYVCDKGHYQTQTVRSIRKNRKCYECYKYGTYDRVVKTFEKEGYTMMTTRDEYIDTKTNVIYRCNKGHVGQATVSDLNNGNRCAKCNHIKLSEKYRLPLSEIIDAATKSNYEIISGCENYKNGNSRFIFKCPEGHVYETSAVNFRHLGSRCKKCSDLRNSGENNYAYSGGLRELNRYVRDKTYRWKIDSLEQGNYKCFVNEYSQDKLVVHHPINLGRIVTEVLSELSIDLKPDINNYSEQELDSIVSLSLKKHYDYGLGVVLSEKLHRLFHKIYGNKNNSMEQLLEFKQNYKNGKYDSVIDNLHKEDGHEKLLK